MRVGILTFHYVYNYGAVLQVYGLSRRLQRLGVEPVVLDYRPFSLLLRGRGLKDLRFVSTNIRRWRFDAFRRRHLPSSRRLRTREDLADAARSLDAVVVGSDQVWNANFQWGFDPAYFLDFVPEDRRRISYGACFGRPEQPEAALPVMRELLGRFDAISVRNAMSHGMVKEMVGRDVETVVDPTLLEDFAELPAKPTPREPFVLVYPIHQAVSQAMGRAAVLVGERLGMPVASINQLWDLPAPVRQIRAAGPLHWLSLFRAASFVCTDSFHGTIFAIKHRKPFIALLEGWATRRIADLLERCGLSERLVENDRQVLERRLWEAPADFDGAGIAIERDVARSVDYLASSLGLGVPAGGA